MNEQGSNAGITRPAPGYWTYPTKGKGTEKHQPGHQKGRKGTKTVPKAKNGFLNTIIKPISISQSEPLFSEENYMSMYESAKNYAKLLGKTFSLEADPEDFRKLFITLRNMLPQEHDLDLTSEDKDLYFVVTDDRAKDLTYFIPLKIISETQGKLQRIYRSFFALLRKWQEVSGFTIDTFIHYIEHDISQTERLEWEELKKEYKQGEISKIFAGLEKEPEYDLEELKKQIKAYNGRRVKTKAVLNLMSEGLELFDKGKVFDHYCCPLEDEYYYESYCPVDMKCLISFVYAPDDLMTRKLHRYIEDEAHEQGYEFLIYELVRLSPCTKKPLEESEFLISFMDWLKRFCDELRN